MKTTVASLAGVAPCENRNLTSSEDTDLLPDFLGSLCFVLSVPNSCGKCGDSLQLRNYLHNQIFNSQMGVQASCGWPLSNENCFIFGMSTTL